ncbi:MAG: hypothetical protein AABY15_08140, partial [Nanoarchaeota archaeon]
MRSKNIIISILALILLTGFISAYLNVSLADHGSNIRNKSSGALLDSSNLRIEIYDALSGGNLAYNETFTSAIINGSWNLMLGENSSNPLSLEFGKIYYKDYIINGENVNFTNLTGSDVGRQFFYSPLGDIAGEDINQSANIVGASLNATGNIWAYRTLNLTSGYLYATNGSLINWANVLNGTLASWANVVNGTMASWANVVNGTVLTAETLWNANYSNMSIGWLYATNSTGGSDTFIANYSTFLTHATWANVNNGTMLNYTNALNGTLMLAANWNATNASYRTINNLSFIGNFSFNGGWQSGGLTIQDGDLYAQKIYVYNITSLNVSQQNLSIIDDFRAYGNAQVDKNLTVGTNTFFVNFNNGRIGIGTITPQNTLNIIGIGNFTEDIFSKERNLSIGYDYAVNSTGGGISWADVNNGTMLNYTSALNGSLILGTNLTYAYSLAWQNNASNFTVVYGYALNATGITWATANNGTLLNYSSALNGTLLTAETLWNANYSAFLGKASWADVNNGTMLNYTNALNGTITAGLINWATANNGTLLNYSSALNGTIVKDWQNNASNFTTIYSGLL